MPENESEDTSPSTGKWGSLQYQIVNTVIHTFTSQ